MTLGNVFFVLLWLLFVYLCVQMPAFQTAKLATFDPYEVLALSADSDETAIKNVSFCSCVVLHVRVCCECRPFSVIDCKLLSAFACCRHSFFLSLAGVSQAVVEISPRQEQGPRGPADVHQNTEGLSNSHRPHCKGLNLSLFFTPSHKTRLLNTRAGQHGKIRQSRRPPSSVGDDRSAQLAHRQGKRAARAAHLLPRHLGMCSCVVVCGVYEGLCCCIIRFLDSLPLACGRVSIFGSGAVNVCIFFTHDSSVGRFLHFVALHFAS